MGKKNEIARKRYSFRVALGQIKKSKFGELKARLCAVLGYENASSWSRCLHGISPSYGVALEVERVFKEYGIDNCWEEV